MILQVTHTIEKRSTDALDKPVPVKITRIFVFGKLLFEIERLGRKGTFGNLKFGWFD